MPDAGERVTVTDADVDLVFAVLRARHGEREAAELHREAVRISIACGNWPIQEYRAVAAVALSAAQAENARLRGAMEGVRAKAVEDAARICELRARSLAEDSRDYLSANEAGKCAVAIRWLVTDPTRFDAALSGQEVKADDAA